MTCCGFRGERGSLCEIRVFTPRLNPTKETVRGVVVNWKQSLRDLEKKMELLSVSNLIEVEVESVNYSEVVLNVGIIVSEDDIFSFPRGFEKNGGRGFLWRIEQSS